MPPATLPKDAAELDTPEQEAAFAGIQKAFAPTPGEPAVLSSVSGANKFQTNVQPQIDAANATLTDAQKTAAAKVAAAFAPVQDPNAVPADVQAEIDSSKTPEQLAYEQQLANWDDQEKTAKEVYDSMSLARTAAAQAQIGSLTGIWKERRALLQQSNKQNESQWTQQFFRSGQAEYSPGMTSDMITGKEQEGIRKVKALDDDFNSTVASINAAVDEKNFEGAAALTQTLQGIREKSLAAMKQNAKEAREINDKLRENAAKVSRQSAIANLFAQGITEPADILDYINYHDDGTQVGDITLEDIADTLKIINPSADMAGLDGDFKTFSYLQKNQPDQVKGMNYFDYLNAVGNAKRKATGEGGSAAFKFTPEQTSQLLSGNFTQSDIIAMQADIAAHGIETTVASMPEDQKKLVKRVLGKSDSVGGDLDADDGGEFLTADYLSKLYGEDGLKTAADEAGYRHVWTDWGTERKNYLDSLMNTVQQYRDADYTDKEILKMMQS